jgi:two-component system, OmpR family, response regulator
MEISKVMIVDDDAFIRQVAQMTLARVGNWTVVAAPSGSAALKMIPEEQPDIILLDVMMPGMDGPTTLSKIREEYPTIPVIFMTAKVQHHEVEAYLSSQADGVISKPFDPMELPNQIQSIMANRKNAECNA